MREAPSPLPHIPHCVVLKHRANSVFLVVIRLMTNCLACGYILGQYLSNMHNLLYKTWADRPGMYTDALYLRGIKGDEEQE
jgi:hypothetical protein